MSDYADINPGYEPSGGWGYHEWEAAGNEAWDHYAEATAQGDSTGAAQWEEIAQTSAQNSHDGYVAGGPAYGSGGDASGSNDGSYFGAGGGSSYTPMDYSAYGGSDSASVIDSGATDITSVL